MLKTHLQNCPALVMRHLCSQVWEASLIYPTLTIRNIRKDKNEQSSLVSQRSLNSSENLKDKIDMTVTVWGCWSALLTSKDWKKQITLIIMMAIVTATY